MSRAPVGRTDEEQMLAAWQWAGEAAKQHGVAVDVSIRPTPRKGVWRLVARALQQVDGKPVSVQVQVALEWPHSQHQTFTGAVMNALMQLDHELGYDGLAREQPA